MRSIITILILSCSTIILYAQLPQLDVEGHAKIRGNIDMHHMDDSTSVFIGRNAGVNTSFIFRRYNTFVGSHAGYNNTDGSLNSFFGVSAGFGNSSGDNNSFFGRDAGFDNTSGDNNSFFGSQAGFNNFLGYANSFFGRSAGVNNISGTRNTFLGYEAEQLTYGDSLDRAIAIGYNAKVNCSNCAVIGGTGPDSVNVGIGIDSPQYKLHVIGDVGINGNLTMKSFSLTHYEETVSSDTPSSGTEFDLGAHAFCALTFYALQGSSGTNRWVKVIDDGDGTWTLNMRGGGSAPTQVQGGCVCID